MDARIHNPKRHRSTVYKPKEGIDTLSNQASGAAHYAAELLISTEERRALNALPKKGTAVGNTLLVSIRAAIRDLTMVEYRMSVKDEE